MPLALPADTRFALPVSLIQNSAPQREQIGIQGYFMSLHEYQSKHLFDLYGFPTPEGQAACAPEQAPAAARQMGRPS